MGDWFENQVVYSLYVQRYADADGDGVGDLEGLTERLEHLAGLGVGCIWLLPILASPMRDGGYDVADYYRLDPRIGDFDDLARFLGRADALGLRVVQDLPVNHTSRDHPWFQEARRNPDSPYRDYYIWSDDPEEFEDRVIFRGPQTTNWTWDEQAEHYYYHTFYPHEPDLNVTNPRVRAEIEAIMRFWLRVGFAGFRLDALAHMFREKGDLAFDGDPFHHIHDWRELVESERTDGVLIGELDVEPWEYARYIEDGGRRIDVLLNFYLCAYVYLAFARQSAEPLRKAFDELPELRGRGSWGIFLRNHDELDLQRLEESEMQEVFEAFAPEQNARAFQRGIRRRLAPMLGDDRRRLELAHSLLLTLPGTPFLYYGEEIAMGDDLSRPEREPIRAPMQWANVEHGGFSPASAGELEAPIVEEGRWGYPTRNVTDQSREADSFLNWLRMAIQVRTTCAALGEGHFEALAVDDARAFVHVCGSDGTLAVAAHNFSESPIAVELSLEIPAGRQLVEIFHNGDDASPAGRPDRLELAPYGYRWFECVDDGGGGG